MDDVQVNRQPWAATMNEALPHAANRVRLAKAEQADARIALMHAKNALKAAEQHMLRCDAAAAGAESRLTRLAETGRVDAYCPVHDLFYSFAPVVPKTVTGAVDHCNAHESFRRDGAPPCPECAGAAAAELERQRQCQPVAVIDKHAFLRDEKGANAQSRQNWML